MSLVSQASVLSSRLILIHNCALPPRNAQCDEIWSHYISLLLLPFWFWQIASPYHVSSKPDQLETHVLPFPHPEAIKFCPLLQPGSLLRPLPRCSLAVFAPLHILSHLFFGLLQGSPNWFSCLFSCSLSFELSFAARGILKCKSEQLPTCFCDHFACPHYPQIKSKFPLPLKHTPSHTTPGTALRMGHASVLCLWALPFLFLLGMSLLPYANSK